MDKIFPYEIEEVLEFLSKTSDRYAIFAGFASYLLLGTETSDDVVVLFENEAVCRRIQDRFCAQGWETTKDAWESECHLNIVLKKNNCEFDLVFSRHAARCYLTEVREVSHREYTLFSLNPEAMLLIKLNQLADLSRSNEKHNRDRYAIKKLRGLIDHKRVREIAARLEARYWCDGRY